MHEQQNEFIQSLNGELTPEQAAQLLEMGEEGDTGTPKPEEGGAPDATPAQVDADGAGTAKPEEAKGDAVDESTLTPENAVILAKDGKHTIDYQKLVDAREAAQQAKAEADATRRELEALKAQAQARADAGEAPTKVDNQVATAEAAIAGGVDPGLFGDFSEEALTKGIAALVEQRVAAATASMMAKLEPIQQRQQIDATEAHYRAIYTAHPDADSIAESKELSDWIKAQPTFVQATYSDVLKSGTTAAVIELFDQFKRATGSTQTAAGADANDVKQAAQAAIAKAKVDAPTSLSDIPGGRAGAATRTELMADMDGRDLLETMADMSPEQIETFLNRRI